MLLFFGVEDFFENIGLRRVLTQSVTGCCCCLDDKTFYIWKSWAEEGVGTVGNGVLLLFERQNLFLEILGGGRC